MLLILTLSIFFGSLLGKLIFYNFNKEDFINYFNKDNKLKEALLIFFTIPLANFLILEKKAKILLKKENSQKKYFILKNYNLIAELLGIITLVLLLTSFSKSITSNFSSIEIIFLIISQILICFSLLYLAIYDVLTLSIPVDFTKKVLFGVIAINLIVGLIRFFIPDKALLDNIHLGYLDNLLSGIGIAFLMWVIVKVTKEKGLGEGDIDIMLIIGLFLGWPGVLLSYLSTLIVGSLISLSYAFYLKKFKGVIVPFVPFILLGFLIVLAFERELTYLFIPVF